MEPESEEGAQVDRGGSQGPPGVVLGNASVAQTACTSGEPGDGAFDHGPVAAVGGLELRVAGPGAVFAADLVVLADDELAAPVRGRAPGPQRADLAGCAERGLSP